MESTQIQDAKFQLAAAELLFDVTEKALIRAQDEHARAKARLNEARRKLTSFALIVNKS